MAWSLLFRCCWDKILPELLIDDDDSTNTEYETHFDDQLLFLISTRRNHDQVKWILTAELAKAHDHYVGTLLHYAALTSNDVIACELIKLGSNVDSLNSKSRTPLMIAVGKNHAANIVAILLKANANIHIVDDQGNSVLQMIFSQEYTSVKVIEAILRKLQSEVSSVEELLDKLLMNKGFSLYHAATLRDIKVMECALKRGGFEVDSRGPRQQTALYAAVELNDLAMVEWLICQGANIDAKDNDQCSPLIRSAQRGRDAMVELLLKLGADANVKNAAGYRALFTAVYNSMGKDEISRKPFDRCVELLLLYDDGIPHEELFRTLEYALCTENHIQIHALVARLAMLGKLATSVVTKTSVFLCCLKKCPAMLPPIAIIYELCEQLLDSNVFTGMNLSLFDFLNENEAKMKIHARNVTRIEDIESICVEMKDHFPLYCKLIRKRFSEAIDAVTLDETAILALCVLFQINRNLCYNFGRIIVAYLSKKDLERLCHACAQHF